MITRSGFCCCGGLRLRLGSAIENEHQRGFAAALAFDSRILGPKHSNCQRDDFFLPKAGFIRILSPGKPGTPPCKSGQLEKDLGLEVSSVRHAARLIIFEIMIWIQLKPSRCIALTAYCQGRPESCAVETGQLKTEAADFTTSRNDSRGRVF